MSPAEYHTVVLGPEETAPGHRVADPMLYQSDLALMNYLLQDLRALVRQAANGYVVLDAHQHLTWQVHGLARRTVICDPERLREPVDVHIVGFFGNRRGGTDRGTIDRVNAALMDEFRDYPGILSYSSIELADDHWANLVVHRDPTDREAWRSGVRHTEAAEELSPGFYHDVRIHNGCLPGGVIGPDTVIVERTKYWDYDVTPTWHAVRELPGGATETVERPA